MNKSLADGFNLLKYYLTAELPLTYKQFEEFLEAIDSIRYYVAYTPKGHYNINQSLKDLQEHLKQHHEDELNARIRSRVYDDL